MNPPISSKLHFVASDEALIITSKKSTAYSSPTPTNPSGKKLRLGRLRWRGEKEP